MEATIDINKKRTSWICLWIKEYKAKKRRENEDKAKAQSQPLPEREVTQPQEILKRKTIIPGGCIDNDDKEEGKLIMPKRYKSPRPFKFNKEAELARHKNKTPQKQPMDGIKIIIKAPKEEIIAMKPNEEDREEVPLVEKVMNKVLDQKINITLEEISTISPRFRNELKFISDRENKFLMSVKSVNNEERVEDQEGNLQDIIIEERIHYSCPLGMIEVYIGMGGHKIKALVDTGSELSIIPEVESIKEGIPMRALNMRGAVYPFIGRTFLADNGIRLEHSQTQGEVFIFRELDGRRLCIHIRSPESKGWHAQPPKGMEFSNMEKVEEMEVPDNNKESRFGDINSEEVQEMEEEQEISGLYEENILEFQEKHKKKEVKLGNIPNMEKHPSIEKV
ncbi:hypothetical protein O181_085657 [Austropuccinia psidii MF-1]|uniref:Peptidase A2 domain-containing protein n=1 Tax=Austropuccinia psidii MF-1 TaxID=1389203 RepID=A0A9Q3FYG0_9BASI|nr:hypothetical protein [Austropuccinia psidii MF-1]